MKTKRVGDLLGQKDAASLALAGMLSDIGAAGLVIANVFYALSPVAAASPQTHFDLAAAMAATVSGANSLRAAGMVGMFGDVVWATGAMLLSQEFSRSGRILTAAGFGALFLAIDLFIFVDAMTGFVFPPLAAASNAPSFEGLRRLWDVIFLLSVIAYGLGSITIAVGELHYPVRMFAGPLAWALLVVALTGSFAAIACFAGISSPAFPLGEIAGGSIGLGAVLYVPISVQIAHRGASSRSLAQMPTRS